MRNFLRPVFARVKKGSCWRCCKMLLNAFRNMSWHSIFGKKSCSRRRKIGFLRRIPIGFFRLKIFAKIYSSTLTTYVEACWFGRRQSASRILRPMCKYTYLGRPHTRIGILDRQATRCEWGWQIHDNDGPLLADFSLSWSKMIRIMFLCALVYVEQWPDDVGIVSTPLTVLEALACDSGIFADG